MARNPFAVAVSTPPPRLVGQRGYRPGGMRAVFNGAELDRHTADWTPYTFSPDYEVRNALRFMRARARQLVRDNGYAAGIVRAISDNVIGPRGMLLQAKVRTTTGALAKGTNQEIERGWKAWGDPETASADGRDSWVDIQRLFLETMVVDGEVILRRLRGFDNPFGYALQFIDADLLDELYTVPRGAKQNEVRMGVELDEWNRPVAYHIWNRYAADMSGLPRVRERIPASEIQHRFIRYRPNQTRGVTVFAPVMVGLKHIDGYERNELEASRAAAAKMGFILNKSQEAIQGFDWGDRFTKDGGPKVLDVEAGLIPELLPGQEFATFDPTHPATTFDAFLTAVLRSTSRGLNVSHFTMTGDTRQANYSSLRQSLGPERDHWRALQGFVATHCHRVVYRDWLAMALLSGAIRLDSRLASNYTDVEWRGRGWAWVDPKNDAEAAKLLLDLGLTTRTHLAAERGDDFEENVDQLAEEEAYAEAAGVDVSGNQIAGVMPASVSPEGKQEDAAQNDGSGDAPPDASPARTARAAIIRTARIA